MLQEHGGSHKPDHSGNPIQQKCGKEKICGQKNDDSHTGAVDEKRADRPVAAGLHGQLSQVIGELETMRAGCPAMEIFPGSSSFRIRSASC